MRRLSQGINGIVLPRVGRCVELTVLLLLLVRLLNLKSWLTVWSGGAQSRSVVLRRLLLRDSRLERRQVASISMTSNSQSRSRSSSSSRSTVTQSLNGGRG